LTALHNVTIKGQSKFVSAIQVAQLALKHRQNKNQRQRVIAFVGSPLEDDQKELVKLGKKLKKNNVAVDVINFGETAENQEKLEAFIGAINNNDNSNLLTVPPGPHILSDIIISSPILQDGEGGGPSLPMAGSGMGGGDFDFGVDPSIDPELAMALRISAEEERQRQERAGKTEGDGAAAEGGAAATPAAGGGDAAMADNEDDMLQQALAMSMQQDQKAATPAKDATPAPRPAAAAPGVDVSPGTLAAISASEQMAQDEDEEMRLAMAMSVEGQADKGGAAAAALLQDASFLNNVLSSLPGVDTSDPRVQGVLDGMKQDEDKDKKDGAKGGDKK
jgi:26S proteasome regulatory subunit N10